MPRPRVSLLIPTLRNIDRLRACLVSLANDETAVSREILILCNGVPAASLAAVGDLADVALLESPVNLGVAGAFNRLRIAARGELLALLHDDVVVYSGWLDRLVATLDEHPGAGVCGGMVLDRDGSLRSDGSILWADGVTTPRWCEPKPDPDLLSEVEPVDYVGTSFALVRATTFDRIGGLDEAFYPAYYVDVSMALAVRAAGQVVMVDPGARQVHFEGSSTEARKGFLQLRNRELLLARWGGQLARDHQPAYCPGAEARRVARQRARDTAVRLQELRSTAVEAPPQAFHRDPARQERDARRAERALRVAWEAARDAFEPAG